MKYLVGYMLPLIIVLTAVPLVLGKVPPNGLYGFRTEKTQSSPEVWYPANRFAGWAFVVAGLITVGINFGLILLDPGWPPRILMRWMAISTVVPLLIGTLVSFVYLRRL